MTKKSIIFSEEEQIKKQFEEIAENLGLTTSALLHVYVRKVIETHAIPFTITTPTQARQTANNHKAFVAAWQRKYERFGTKIPDEFLE
ncbi:MAG: type II toxin-antitoxin system RelB/DinJ family antitoxin [Streptococcaceae bacterium]|jgi:addiction module RelB/DinJ family antitoxin|nr:type II toxin-antitoxin system RelB/DinJ family antitoxin [Streptococcaceae bacterium]